MLCIIVAHNNKKDAIVSKYLWFQIPKKLGLGFQDISITKFCVEYVYTGNVIMLSFN